MRLREGELRVQVVADSLRTPDTKGITYNQDSSTQFLLDSVVWSQFLRFRTWLGFGCSILSTCEVQLFLVFVQPISLTGSHRI